MALRLHLEQELWSKRVAPTASQAIACQHKNRILPVEDDEREPSPLPDQNQVEILMEVVEKIGLLVQNRQTGFLPNKRQQHMAGFAAIEFAQTFLQVVSSLVFPFPFLYFECEIFEWWEFCTFKYHEESRIGKRY